MTRSRYNHVRLVVDTDGGVIEANPDGADRGHVHSGDVVVSPPLTDEQRARIPALAEALLGTPYGFLDVAALGLASLGFDVPSVRRRIIRPDRLFCSQLADLVLTQAGYQPFADGRTPQAVSPGDFADLAFREGWPVIQHP
ncbi:MAG: hypothetical protein IRZ07_29950 [Microbispora sp.]|nr:hypothetical protein [Microbispora sp.]